MAVNRGKKFEQIIKESFEKVPGVSVDRLHDQMNGYLGSRNICDFIVYKYPHQYYIECKTIHGNTFPLSNITNNQYNGLLEKDKIAGVRAGVIIWWVDKDVTKFIPIHLIKYFKNEYHAKSIRYDFKPFGQEVFIPINGKKKRVFFDYDMQQFFADISEEAWGGVYE